MMGAIAEALIELGIDVKGAEEAEQSVTKVKKSTESLKKDGGGAIDDFVKGGDLSMQGLVKSFAGSQAALVLGAGAIAAAVVAAGKVVVDFVNETTAGLDSLAKSAKASGLGAEQYQRLSVVAEHAGTSIDVLSKATQKVNTGLFDISSGGGADFLANLNKIGLAAEDLQGLDQTAQLGVISDALNKVSSDADRAALAAKIFGEEAGPNMASLIEAGSEGINQMSEDVGKVFTKEQLAQAEAYQDSLTDLKHTVGVLSGEVALSFVPVIKDAVEGIREWIKENQEGINAVMKVINVALKPLIKTLELLLIPLKLQVEWSLKFYEAIAAVGEALADLANRAGETAMEWEWVQDLVKAFDEIVKVVDRAKKEVVEFISQFEPLRRLAIKLGIITPDEGGSGLQGAKDKVVGLFGGAKDTAENQALQAQNEQQQDARRKQEAKGRATGVLNQYSDLARPLTDREKADIYRTVGDPEVASEAINSIAWNVMNNQGKAPKGGGRGSKPKDEKPIRQLTSFEELLMSTLGPGFTLEGMPIKEVPLADKDIKPEAVVTINNFTMTLSQEINGTTDAQAIGLEAAKAARVEIQNMLNDAGQAPGAAVNFAR
jgi:hypothetical protein